MWPILKDIFIFPLSIIMPTLGACRLRGHFATTVFVIERANRRKLPNSVPARLPGSWLRSQYLSKWSTVVGRSTRMRTHRRTFTHACSCTFTPTPTCPCTTILLSSGSETIETNEKTNYERGDLHPRAHRCRRRTQQTSCSSETASNPGQQRTF